ncbi:aminoglycoside adenylyltransferase domain-containing protein [Terrabacter sp. BE26]|uniref:aminoglycoside adenylyltransferase domain-containing protein n=1 Tax=Terrabacter sp. BE26 TaxID=2898152 RepID=UPI0035BE2076
MPPLPPDLPAADGGASAAMGDLARGLAAALDGNLLGLYVHGSLVAGDFSPARSDLDLLAVLRNAPDEAVLAAVAPVHEWVESRHPAWRGRVEVETVGVPTLVAFGAVSSAATSGRRELIMRVSPGEALHLLPATTHRILTWATVREKGRPIVGPPAAELLPPIAPGAVRTALLEHVRDWPVWVEDMTTVGAQAYAVLSMCRAWCALVEGEQRSKKAAANRFAPAHPGDAELVVWARDWWYAGGSDEARSRFGEVQDFVVRASRSLLDGSSPTPP